MVSSSPTAAGSLSKSKTRFRWLRRIRLNPFISYGKIKKRFQSFQLLSATARAIVPACPEFCADWAVDFVREPKPPCHPRTVAIAVSWSDTCGTSRSPDYGPPRLSDILLSHQRLSWERPGGARQSATTGAVSALPIVSHAAATVRAESHVVCPAAFRVKPERSAPSKWMGQEHRAYPRFRSWSSMVMSSLSRLAVQDFRCRRYSFKGGGYHVVPPNSTPASTMVG